MGETKGPICQPCINLVFFFLLLTEDDTKEEGQVSYPSKNYRVCQ